MMEGLDIAVNMDGFMSVDPYLMISNIHARNMRINARYLCQPSCFTNNVAIAVVRLYVN